jgi:hypothetical protein
MKPKMSYSSEAVGIGPVGGASVKSGREVECARHRSNATTPSLQISVRSTAV